MKTVRNPETIHPPLAAYSHQIELDASERVLYVSGQIGMRQDGSVPDDPIEQLRIALENIRRNLDAAGMTVQDIVKMTLYLVDQMDNAERRRIFSEFSEGTEPCMTGVYVAGLAAPNLKLEIDVVASSEAQPD